MSVNNYIIKSCVSRASTVAECMTSGVLCMVSESCTKHTSLSLLKIFCFRVSTISGIIHETCGALIKVLAPTYLKTPRTEAEWQAVARDFVSKTQYPNCIGAVDGKI